MIFRAPIRTVFLLACLTLLVSSTCFCQSLPAQPYNTASPSTSAADIEAAVALLCKPADINRSKSGAISGCKACPKGTDFFGQNMGGWDLGKATVGHFTSAS